MNLLRRKEQKHTPAESPELKNVKKRLTKVEGRVRVLEQQVQVYQREV